MIDVIKYLKEITESITTESEIIAVSPLVYDLKKESYETIGQSLQHQGGGSIIQNFISENRIKTDKPIIGETATLSPPNFYHGTILDLNSEIGFIRLFSDKYPMIYLHERYTETYFDKESSFSHEGNYRIFFLTEGDFQQWLIKDFKIKGTDKMRNLSHLFVEKLRKSKELEISGSYSITNKNRFASYSDSKGEIKKDIQDNMTGVELNINLQFYKTCTCQ